MHLSDDSAKLMPEEVAALVAYMKGRCTAVQQALNDTPTSHDLNEIIFPHVRECRPCALDVSAYFRQHKAT